MPTAPLRPCRGPACPNHTRNGYCPSCRAARERRYEASRGTAAERGYGRAWQRLRLEILARDAYLCQECRRNGHLHPVGKSGHVDHIVPKARGGTDSPANLETLCRRCHSRKTAREDGRWG